MRKIRRYLKVSVKENMEEYGEKLQSINRVLVLFSDPYHNDVALEEITAAYTS